MKYSMFIFVTVFLRSFCVFSSARADFVPADAAEPRYEILLTASQDLSDWLATQSPARTEITGGGTIVVSGAYTLSVSTDALAGFTGDVYICKGTRVKTSVANPLGTTEGKVVVENGATLNTTWADVNTPVNFGNKPVYIAGKGTDNKGAIYVTPLTGNKVSGHPGEVYLTDDALAGCSMQTRISGNVHLEGHTFTSDYSGGWTYWMQDFYDSTGNGNVIVAREILLENRQPNFKFGGPANTLTYRNGAGFRTNNYTQNQANPWTMVMEAGSYFYCGGGTSTWYGDVVLGSGPHQLRHQNFWAIQRYYGKITGPGGIGKSNNQQTEKIELHGAENDFAGGVYLTCNVLTLGCNGALPAAGGPLTNVNSTVMFGSATDFYDLPEAYFSGTGNVVATSSAFRPQGVWRRQIVKDGEGALNYNALIGSPKLEVKGGSIKFPVAAASDALPVFTNVQVRAGASVTFGDGFTGFWAVPRLMNGGGEIRGSVTAEGFAVDPACAEEPLTVTGALAFTEDACLEVPETLSHETSKTYTLATAATITGRPRAQNSSWHAEIVSTPDGRQSLRIAYTDGFTIIVR